MKKAIRHWLIKQGLIKAKSITEIQEIFSFPVDTIKQEKKPFWMINHLEKLPYSNKPLNPTR
jgi:hypothetical protein